MRFILEIDCSNDAFEPGRLVSDLCHFEVSRILTVLAGRIVMQPGDVNPELCVFKLRDIDGNRVGVARYVSDGCEEE